MVMDDQKCENCKFWTPPKSSYPKHGYCLYNPPVAKVEHGSDRWPELWPDEWCGKWYPSNKALIEKYPALKEAYDHYLTLVQLIGETEE